MNYWKLRWVLPLLLGIGVMFIPIPSSSKQAAEHTYRLHASTYDYSPSVIRAEPGDQVTIELVSTDVVHGLYIDGYDLSIQADPGKPQTLIFTADKAGSFRMRCSVTCGPLHPFMIAKLEVGNSTFLWRGAGLMILASLAALIFYRYESNRTNPQQIY